MAKRPKPCLLELNLELRALALEKLELKWSPEQISAETIYKTIYFRNRAALNHLLARHLHPGHILRHSKRHTRKGERGTIISSTVFLFMRVPNTSIIDVPLATGRAI